MAQRLKKWFWDWGNFWLLMASVMIYPSWGSSFMRRHGWLLTILIDLAMASAFTWFTIRFAPKTKIQGK